MRLTGSKSFKVSLLQLELDYQHNNLMLRDSLCSVTAPSADRIWHNLCFSLVKLFFSYLILKTEIVLNRRAINLHTVIVFWTTLQPKDKIKIISGDIYVFLSQED